jgi:hypothetical protein
LYFATFDCYFGHIFFLGDLQTEDLVACYSILKEAWAMFQTDDNVKSDKIRALALAKECYAMKLELLTNAMVVDDVIKFVRQQQKPLSSVDTVSNGSKENKEDKEKSKIPEYEKIEKELEEEKTGEEQKEESVKTVNKIF